MSFGPRSTNTFSEAKLFELWLARLPYNCLEIIHTQDWWRGCSFDRPSSLKDQQTFAMLTGH